MWTVYGLFIERLSIPKTSMLNEIITFSLYILQYWLNNPVSNWQIIFWKETIQNDLNSGSSSFDSAVNDWQPHLKDLIAANDQGKKVLMFNCLYIFLFGGSAYVIL